MLARFASVLCRGALSSAFARLSEQSRYKRFLSPHARLSPSELRYLTDVDHHDHEALVAIDPATNQGIGVARYIRSQDEPNSAELAVAVIDPWQGRGVGTRLVEALAERARAERIGSFRALVLIDNEQMLNLLADLGRVRVLHRQQGTVELTVELPETGVGHLRRLLRAVAGGELRPLPHHHQQD